MFPLRFAPYEATLAVPNVVVDGSPNGATTLSLSHWPRLKAPDGLADDSSAQMAFRYLDRGADLHGAAEVVTNNHFDQDGLVSAFALTNPDEALRRRALLEDIAAAGDFATYRDRTAARASTVLSAFSDPERSPLAPLPADYGATCALLYDEMLGRLPELIDNIDGYRDLWAEEDSHLTVSERALASGAATISEDAELDLAVVTINEELGPLGGHRFGGRSFQGFHPMALHNATDRVALLLLHNTTYRFTYRYEGWVQFCSRRVRPRVDLEPLAVALTQRESNGAVWASTPPGDLTPELFVVGIGESSLVADEIVEAVRAHLRTAPAAWNPWEAITP